MKKIIALLLVCTMMFGFAALAESKGELHMATNCAFPPYEFYDDETGEPTGIDVEIVKMIVEEMGYTFVMDDMDFGSVISGVQAGKYDIGAGAITITEERKQSVDFTTPYEVAQQQVVVMKDSAIATIEDLNAAEGITIGVQQDTTGDLFVSEAFEATGKATCSRFKTGTDAILALTAGKVDAVVIDNGPAKAYLAKDENLTSFVEADCAGEEYGFCFAKENPLYAEFNAILEAKLADGTVDAIIAEFYGMMGE